MRTANELATNIGATATYTGLGELRFAVKIIDTRDRWGEVDYLITPVAGEGRRWVTHHKISNIRKES